MPSENLEQKYLSQHDVSLRLYHSIVRYKNDFVYVNPPTQNLDHPGCTLIQITRLKDQINLGNIDANDPDIDITSPDLGWMESTDTGYVYYVCRVPYRRQKQGISRDNLLAIQPNADPLTPSIFPLNTDSIMSRQFARMLNGVSVSYYHTLIKVSELKSLTATGSPLSRLYALVNIDRKTLLFKRSCPIGEAFPDGVTLYPMYNNSITTMQLSNLGVPLKHAE